MTDEGRDVDHVTARQGAAMLLSFLEGHGATFRIDDDGFLHCDLDRCTYVTDYEQADMLAHAVLGIAEEIKYWLRQRSTTH